MGPIERCKAGRVNGKQSVNLRKETSAEKAEEGEERERSRHLKTVSLKGAAY